jgi:hypothetical protein
MTKQEKTTMTNHIAPYTRNGLLESIAVANALALSTTNTAEYLHWEAREMELRGKAGQITPLENEQIAAMSRTRRHVYGARS